MKYISSKEYIDVPEGVTVNVKARVVTVTGPRGTLTKNLQHVDVAFKPISATKIELEIFHGNRKRVATLRTVKTLVQNMVTGVTKGYKYKMRYVYAHFPITVNLEKNGTQIEIRNYLGQKKVRIIQALEGVTAEVSKNVKDELILTGNSIDNVSQTAATINQSCLPRDKDIRKFLDGIYVSEKGVIKTED